MEQFEAYFQRADLNRDGRISGEEAVAFFQGFNLPKNVLAQIWMHSDPKNKGFLNQPEFFNALRLATVAQSRKDLTKEIVKAALEGPAAAKIPPPRIYSVLAPTTTVNSMSTTRPPVNSALLSPLSSMGSIPATPSSNVATHRQQMPLVTGPNQQVSSNIMKPFHGTPSSSLLVQPVNQSLPGGGTMAGPHPPSSNFPILTTDWPSGSRGGSLATGIPGNGTTSLGDKDGLAPASSVLMTSAVALPKGTTSLSASLPPKPVNSLLSSAKTVDKDLKASIASANGFSSDSIFGDVFSASKIKQESSLSTVSTSSVPVTTYTGTVATGNQPPRAAQVNSLDSMPTILAGVGPLQQNQSFVKQNQQNAVTIGPVSTSTAQLGNPGVDMAQPPWPKMSQSSIQKYTKVFLEVDKDRDGKITGEQARNLFLSWRLPREILKQVWDLSDQDGDSMLSLREFCIALYLMERYREGRPVPNLLPNSLLYDESLLRVSSQLSVRQGGVAWQPSSGMPNTQPVMPAAGFKSQQQVQMPPQVEVQVQPAQKKRTVPVLEKHLINQLSNEEQSALNSKLKEAADADKKVEELEKEILDSKEKIEFYRTKMQELVLYKSRCDNRLNEIMERVSADKREVEVLAKKYEEKYKHVGDVASKLTAEEATFRDIQEKKLQLFNAIVKINEGGDVNGSLQDRASQVQSDLDDLVRKLNDRCKQYGLRAKPTSLLELPFGWQTGIQEGAADWDEDWDKFENEEFKLVKELTVNVENTVAPPKSKPPTSSNNKEVSKKDSSPHAPPDIDSAAENSAGAGNWPAESEIPHAHGENGSIGSPSSSPPGKNALGSVREFSLPKFETDDVKDNQSDHGGAESTVSSEKHADDHLRVPSFDAHDDADSLWGFNPSYKESGDDRNKHDFSFGSEDFGLNPIRTGSPSGSSLYGKDRSPFFDSVPPSASSVYGKERSPFFDSVPGTPAFDSVFSPRYGEGLDKSFGFDRFDSFSSQGNLSRFDSMRSSKDFDPSNFFSQQEKLTRFDSIRSTSDFGHSQGFPSFDGSDPFGSGPFKSSETPRSSDNWSSF